VWCAQKKKKSDRKIKKSKKKDLTGPTLLEMPPEEAFVVRARWVRFAKSLFFTARAGAVKPRQPLCGLNLSDIDESTAVAGSGVLALPLGSPLVEFSRLLGRFRIH